MAHKVGRDSVNAVPVPGAGFRRRHISLISRNTNNGAVSLQGTWDGIFLYRGKRQDVRQPTGYVAKNSDRPADSMKEIRTAVKMPSSFRSQRTSCPHGPLCYLVP